MRRGSTRWRRKTVLRAPDRIDFYQVSLRCRAAPGLGCGSRAKPLLLELERNPAVAEAWLNRAGTLVAVVRKDVAARDLVFQFARQDQATAARVWRSLERIEATFSDALARARSRGEIAATADVDSLARFLVSGIQGLRLVAKANPDRAALEGIAAMMLRCLDQ